MAIAAAVFVDVLILVFFFSFSPFVYKRKYLKTVYDVDLHIEKRLKLLVSA